MLNFLNLFKNRSAILILLLGFIAAVGLYLWDNGRVHERANDPDGIWTITMEDEATSYTFRGPLDVFLIHRSLVTSHRKLTAHVQSLTMQWHFETGEPWKRWERENPGITENDKSVKLSAKVDVIPVESDRAALAESVYLNHVLNNPNAALETKFKSNVWNNTAIKFDRGYDTHYLIEVREPYDGRVISCNTGPWYCTLYGARVNDTLELDHVFVWKEDVMNWKQYQDKARDLVLEAIVENRRQ